MKFLFWTSFCAITYTFVGFPLLVAILGILRDQITQSGMYTPNISMLIAAHNEASIIQQKLENTFSLNYPKNCFELVVASDGSTDKTEKLVSDYNGGNIKLLSLPRQGKNQAINAAVAVASGEILIFTDADTMLENDSLSYLVAPFIDPEVGGVAGNYFHRANSDKGDNERDFWNFERTLKILQSRAGNVTSAWGPIYAIRKSFFKTVPMGVTDDFFISVQPLMSHRRLLFEPRAKAFGPVANSPQVEFRRKVRIITAGLRSVWETRQLLNPFQYGFLAVQIFSHKILRRLMGLPLFFLFVTSMALWQNGFFFKLMLIFQLIFHGAALLGFLLQKMIIGRIRLLRLPFFFDMVYIASAVAIFNLMRGVRHDIWTPQNFYEK